MNKMRQTRAKIAKQQNNLCYYCEKRMQPVRPDWRGPLPHYAETLDHIIPLSKGGVFAPTKNTVAACHDCNQRRGNCDARIFMLERKGQI